MLKALLDTALRGAALVVTDRRWAAPLSAAALGFGIFAGVAIGPGTAGSLATSAQQIIEFPGSGGDGGQSGGGGGGIASTESAGPALGGEGGGFEALPSTTPLAPAPLEPAPAPVAEPAPKPSPAEEPAEEETEGQMFEGTVVHSSPAAGSYAIAIDGGEVLAVHAPELPEPGTRLSAPLRRLANGTFAEADEPKEGEKAASTVTFRGVVTYASPDPAAPTYTVSGRGASLPVAVTPDPTGAAPALPAIGGYVTVAASIEKATDPAAPQPRETFTLVQTKIEAEPGPPTTYLDLAGTFKELTADGHLLLSTDWTGEGESSLILAVPPGIDASKLAVGDSYLAAAEMAADGSGALTLKGIAADERLKGADDASSAQGDLAR